MPDGALSILVTGAGGFVGRHVVAALRLARPDAAIHDAPFDVTVAGAVDRAVRDAMPDHCFHLAGIAAIADARQDPDRAWAVNLGGTLSLARAIGRHVPACRLVFAGSADGYGASFRAGDPLDEGALLAPLNEYGATKAAADLALGALAADGLRALRFRPFNHVGPGQRDGFVVSAFARQVALIGAGRQAPVIRVGALDPWRDFLDVRDVARAYALTLDGGDDRLPPGTILNLASGVPRQVGAVLADLLRIGGVDARIETDPARLRPTDIGRAVGDAAAARAALGWTPSINWERTLGDVLADWRARIR